MTENNNDIIAPPIFLENNTYWASIKNPFECDQQSLTCSGTTCLAVGTSGINNQSTSSSSYLSWSTQTSGTTWNAVSSTITQNLLSVACLSGSTTCIACGAGGTTLQSIDSGATWFATPNPTFSSSVQLNAVACTGSTCFIAGYAGSMPAKNLLPRVLILTRIVTKKGQAQPTYAKRYGE